MHSHQPSYSKYFVVIALMLSMFALSRGLFIHYHGLSLSDFFTAHVAFADGDGGGDGGDGSGDGGGDGGDGGGGSGDPGGDTPPGGDPSPGPSCTPTEVPQPPVACADYAGQYGIPEGYTEGQASWTINSCTNAITYTGGCSPPAPVCTPVEVPQPPVACADYAGQYGIPADHTVGEASWTINSCTNAITYTGGCSAPAPVCVPTEVPQPPVACADYAGQYGIPEGYTEGQASWTINSCTNAITYTGGCVAPAVTCSLTASPSSITKGSLVALTWRSINANTLSLDQGIGEVFPALLGIRLVSPEVTTTYTGTASGLGGGTSCQVEVRVVDSPPPATPSCTLLATQATIQEGESTTLAWTSNSASSVSINQSIGSVTPGGGTRSVSPATTTTYTATVSGAGGTSTCSTTVTVTPPPPPPVAPTCILTASPGTVTQGANATLTWDTTNATSFSLNQGIGQGSLGHGTRSVAPLTSTTYIGTVTGPGGSATCTATVTVTTLPVPSCSLSVSPLSVQNGSSATLSWTSNNAATLTVGQGIGSLTPVAAGSRAVSPNTTTTYTATATSANGLTTTCAATLTVTEPPPPVAPTCILTASASSIETGSTTTLSWDTANGTSFTLNQGIGSVTPVTGGSRTVSPTTTTTYTGTVTGSGGSATCSKTITVTPRPAPSCTLTASPSTVQTGSSSRLEWTTTNATSFSIDHAVGSVTNVSTGSRSVAPSTTTTYTGTASGSGGTFTCTATVTVTALPAPSCTLQVSPASLVRGGSATLSWSTTNASSVSINQSIGTVATAGGTRTVSPTTTTTYTATVTGANGVTSTCADTVTVTAQPAPTCSLSAAPNRIAPGASSTLTWSTTNATSFVIDHDVGAVTAVGTGSASVSPSVTTIYKGTATGPGGTIDCADTVTVTTQPPVAPTCALNASPTSIQSGNASSLSWSTTNATSFVIDQGVGSLSPVASGTRSVSPTATTTYTGTATGAGGTALCTASVAVTPPPPVIPTCSLSASPTQVTSGSRTVLSWTTTDASAFSIDQGVGTVTPTLSGTTTSPAITAATTFTGTVTASNGRTATCSTQVSVGGGGGGAPTCSLTVSPTSYTAGSSAVLAWNGSNLASVTIDSGIGATTTIPSTVTVAPTTVGAHTYTGSFLGTNGQTIVCSATLTVNAGGGGGPPPSPPPGGGGGGGGILSPNIVLSALPHVKAQPLAYLYLAAIPQTGLSLGTTGTIIYWFVLVLWALALAYLILFAAAPFTAGKLRAFGARVSAAVNALPAHTPEKVEAPHVQPVVTQQHTPAAPTVPAPAPRVERETPEMRRDYSTFEGFKSFATNEALSIEDIVKGLSRQHAATPVRPAYQHVEPVYEHVEPIVPETLVATAPSSAPAPVASAPTSVRGFVAVLLERDREAVFAALRQEIRGGGSAEKLLTGAVCLLDDAYRARIDGSPCAPDIITMTAHLSSPALEKLVGALTTAIDSSYSTDMTGAKLALTRALSTLEV